MYNEIEDFKVHESQISQMMGVISSFVDIKDMLF